MIIRNAYNVSTTSKILMEIPPRYSQIRDLGTYLEARSHDHTLLSPVFRGRYPVCTNGSHKYEYLVDTAARNGDAFVPTTSVPLVVIPLEDSQSRSPVTIMTGTLTSKNTRLNDRVVEYPKEEAV